MKNKGFTLIELLAVIVILAIIAIIAVPIIINIIDDSKDNSILRSADFYLDAVEMSVAQATLKNQNIEDKTYNILENGNICLGYDNDNKCNDELVVEVSGKHPKEGTITITNGIIKNVDMMLSEKRITKNDKGEIIYFPCTKVTGDKNTNGSKYECEVSPGVKYNFYVLSQESDGTTNLIMDRNMCSDETPTKEGKTCLIAWNGEPLQKINRYGPLTAMTYLYNATKSWINIPSLNYIYNDNEFQGATDYGYTSFVSINGIATITSLYGITTTIIGNTTEPLKARLPIYTDYSINLSKNEVSSFNNNGYLFENLDGSFWGYENGKFKTKISDIRGYWTLSSNGGSHDDAWSIYDDGNVEGCIVDNDDLLGVRPVINIKLQ